MTRRLKLLAANFALFQAAWFWCIMAPAGWDIAGGALLLAAHFYFIARRGEWRLIAAVAMLGGAVDSALVAAGVFTLTPAASFAPLWLVLLWAFFAAILPHSLRWLAAYPRAAAAGGAVGAPLAYWGGAKLTDKLAISYDFTFFAAVHAPLWAVLMLVMFALAKRLQEK